MNDMVSRKTQAYWGRRAVGNLILKFNCPEATMQTCQAMIDRREDEVLTSIAGLTGGVVGQGSTCGVVSGGALAIALMHEEALRQNGHATEADVLSQVSEYVQWFGNTYGTTRCSERTGIDFRTLGGLIAYMLPGHRMVRCMSHINGAVKCLYDVQGADLPGLEISNDSAVDPIHCAQTVLQGVSAKTGIGDPVLERISIALDGGVGLQGGACGALVGAILATNLLLGANLREASLPGAYYSFFKGLTYLRADKPESIPDPYNAGKIIVDNFKEVSGSMDCSGITNHKFQGWEDFQAYLRSSSKCQELIELSINEVASANDRYGTAQ